MLMVITIIKVKRAYFEINTDITLNKILNILLFLEFILKINKF